MKLRLTLKARPLFLLLFCLPLFLFPTAIKADTDSKADADSFSKEDLLSDLFDSLPDAVRPELTEKKDTLWKTYDTSYYLSYLVSAWKMGKGRFLSLFTSLFGMLLIAAAVGGLSGSQRKGVSLLLSALMALFLYQMSEPLFTVTLSYIEDIAAFGRALLPIMGVLYAVGGNAATAVTSGASFTLFLSVLETVAARVLLPLIRILFSLSVVSHMGSSDFSLAPLGQTVKKTYITVAVFFSMFLGVTLSAQTLLSSAADNAAFRTVRFAIGNMIPVVGGALGGTLGTLSASVLDLRKTVGGVSSTAVLLLTLPLIFEILLFRFILMLADTAAGILSLKEVKAVIQDFNGIFDVLLATVALSAVAFLLSLTVFAKTAVLI